MKRGLWHQVVIHNLEPTDELVTHELQNDLGRGVQMKRWWTHYSKVVSGGGSLPLPQKESVIIVEYEKKQSRRRRQPFVTNLDNVASVVDMCGRIFSVTTAKHFSGANVVYWEAEVPSREHFHKVSTEFYIFVGGRGLVLLNGEKIRITPGSVVMIPPGVKHCLIPDEHETIKAWVVAAPAWSADDQFMTD